MNALDYALAWIHGERMEAGAVIALGVAMVLCGGLLWKFAVTPAARSLVIPLLLPGILLIGACIAWEMSNLTRLETFPPAHALDPAAFLDKEIARVKEFSQWYVYNFRFGAGLIIAGVAVFQFVSKPTLRSIGLTVVVSGVALLFIDYFSEARAALFLQELVALQQDLQAN